MTDNIFESIGKIAEKISEFTKSIDWEKVKAINEGIKAIPNISITVHDKLLQRGWYLDFSIDMKDVFEIADLDSGEKIDEIMCKTINENLVESMEYIYESCPDRAIVIQKAFELHKREEYDICIPIFLIQADGISNEMFKTSFFGKRDGQTKTEKEKNKVIPKDKLNNRVDYSGYIYPLDVISSINLNTSDRDKINPQLMNRHGIIHGLDIDYGTYKNSCQCIALLKYLITIKNDYIKCEKKID